MFLETALALVGIGFAIGAAATWVLAVRPLDKTLAEIRLAQRRAVRSEVYRVAARREHLGTPYIRHATLPPELEEAIAGVVDEHNASRRALEVVQ